MKNNLLIYSIIFTFAFIISKIVLNSYDLEFMYSVYQFAYFIIYITGVIGFIQITKDNKILLVLAILVILVISYFAFIMVVLSSKSVKIRYVEQQKVVVESWGLPDNMDYYYKYINSYLRSYNEIKIPTEYLNNKNNSNELEKDIVLKFHNKENSNESTFNSNFNR